jgi:hypothetical protein
MALFEPQIVGLDALHGAAENVGSRAAGDAGERFVHHDPRAQQYGGKRPQWKQPFWDRVFLWDSNAERCGARMASGGAATAQQGETSKAQQNEA